MFRRTLIFLSLLIAVSANANYFCSGKVRHISISNTGALWLAVGDSGTVMNVCNVRDDHCKAMVNFGSYSTCIR